MPNVPTTNVGLSGSIQSAAGGSNPASLSEYYAGSSFVLSNGVASAAGTYGAIPASGTISMGSFRNKFFFKATIAANTAGYNVYNAAVAAGFSPSTQTLVAIITVNSGVFLYSPAGGTSFGFDTGGGYLSGVSIHLINNGTICGLGGAGGAGGSSGNGGAGGTGGIGINAPVALRVTNNGTVAGGGGGGGGGGGFFDGKSYFQGGGGGGGRALGAGGVGAANGGTATTAAAGGGGVPGNGAGNGGAGGAFATAGSAGGSSSFSGGGGGSAGAATSGNANITWIVLGTRLGTLG